MTIKLQRACSQVATTTFKSQSAGNMNAGDLKKRIKDMAPKMAKEVTTIMAGVKGTTGWFNRQKLDARVMLQHLGNPTWYVRSINNIIIICGDNML